MNNWLDYFDHSARQLPAPRMRLAKQRGGSRKLSLSLSLPNQDYLNFMSNDYLGFSMEPSLITAAQQALHNYGVASCGAPSQSGYSEEHRLLAQEMAEWLGYAQCLLFNSGFQLNSSLLSQLTDENTWVWLDKRCHASHIDGLLLARAKFTTFTPENFTRRREQILNTKNYRHLILTEGSFSMDGTCRYLEQLIQLKQSNPENILLVIDDAHGIGSLGKSGYGTLEQLGLPHNAADLLIGTFAKAFGSHGGFICGSGAIIDYLRQTVRSQIYSSNLPPALVAASRAGLAIVCSQRGAILRDTLSQKIAYFKESASINGVALSAAISNISPIQLIPCQDYTQLAHIHNYLFNQQILVGKISYPTVAKAHPRCRISLNCTHEERDLDLLLEQFLNAKRHA